MLVALPNSKPTRNERHAETKIFIQIYLKLPAIVILNSISNIAIEHVKRKQHSTIQNYPTARNRHIDKGISESEAAAGAAAAGLFSAGPTGDPASDCNNH